MNELTKVKISDSYDIQGYMNELIEDEETGVVRSDKSSEEAIVNWVKVSDVHLAVEELRRLYHLWKAESDILWWNDRNPYTSKEFAEKYPLHSKYTNFDALIDDVFSGVKE